MRLLNRDSAGNVPPIIPLTLGDWNLFFATAAGSAATLVGLLFVATQLHVEVFAVASNRWAALAQSTLTILSSILIISLSFIVPAIPIQIHGELLVAVIAVVLWRTFRLWWPVMRLREAGRWQRIAQSFWLLVVPIVVYAYVLAGGIQLLYGDRNGVFNVAGAFLGGFSVAMRNSWRLVVEVAKKPV